MVKIINMIMVMMMVVTILVLDETSKMHNFHFQDEVQLPDNEIADPVKVPLSSLHCAGIL